MTENDLTEKDLLKIHNADWETCYIWYDLLNSWKWPDELLPEEPPIYKSSKTRRSALMNIIKIKIGQKYILMKHNSDMTPGEFEHFWKACYEDNTESRKIYMDYLNKK